MAEQHQKNGNHASRSASHGGSKRTQVPGQTPTNLNETSGPNKAWSEAPEAGRGPAGTLARRKRQYLVGTRLVPGLVASPANAIHEGLKQMEDIEIRRRLRLKEFKGSGAAQPGAQEIIVVRMDDQRAEALRQSAPPYVVIEEDARIETGLSMFPASLAVPRSSRAASEARRRREIQFQVLGERDQPLAGASVSVLGRGFATLAITDQAGNASVTILDAEVDLDDVSAIYVQPAADHWECLMERPNLSPAETNVIRLRPLTAPDAAKAADERRPAWGRELMGLDRLAAGLTGAGVRIGLIDSGCDNSHPLLRHVTRGVDLSRGNGAKDWTRDEIGQGTHCAGIIAGAGGDQAPSMAGIAPGAEIHVFKLSPGGRFSDLIEALDQCIESQIDIVHIGVGACQVSELVARKILEARLRGVACIAASGDQGGPVQFPGAVPGVLCVSAVGKVGEFPADTHHALTAIPESIGPAGLFATNFSGAGSQLGVCAPGVAVISSVPGGGLAARDGAAIAAAHVVGFAALILGHHPRFRGDATRGEQRVKALFELVLGSAVRPVFDPQRVGAGLPDFREAAKLGATDVDAWTKTMQNLGVLPGATQGVGERFASVGVPPVQPASAMALMQLHAAGLI